MVTADDDAADERSRARALALYDDGRAVMARGDLHGAVSRLRESVSLVPAAPAVAALGECLLGLSCHAEAVIHLAAALELEGGAVFTRVLLARALDQTGDREQAMRQLRRARTEHPHDPDVRAELQSKLADPRTVARAANRHRLLHELRVTMPALRFDANAPPVEVLRWVGTYVALCVEVGLRGDALDIHVEPAFTFMHRLAVSPDQDVADLLSGTIFPALASSEAATALARRGLMGKSRAAFENALALWGEPKPGPLSLKRDLAVAGLRLCLQEPGPGEPGTLVEIAEAFGRQLAERAAAGAPDDELAPQFRLLSWLGRSHAHDDPTLAEAFAVVLGEIMGSRDHRALDTAARLLSGKARATFTRLR